MLKKKLILIALDEASQRKYVESLKEFFADYLEIEGYSIKAGINGLIEGDLVIITSPVLINIAKKYLSENAKIIFMNRTFSQKSTERLNDLPHGTRAMLVSNSSIAAIEATSTLYELDVKHIDFTPVYPNMDEVPDLRIAVTPGQLAYVPQGVDTIIDIGWRMIDLSTLMDISTRLNILNEELEKRISHYSRQIVSISHGLYSAVKNTNRMRNQMDIVLDNIDDGVIVTDEQYRILHCNKSINRILNINEMEVKNPSIYEEMIPKTLFAKVAEGENLENTLMKSIELNKSLVITKRPIYESNDMFGYVIIIKDITQIESLENQLRKQLKKKGHIAKYEFKDISGDSTVMRECIKRAKKIARIDAPVLIIGESGTGKELFAQSIHNESDRKSKPFIAINCAALPAALLESELFGYEEGAFTGARKGGKKGLFEMAHTGTLFLDEIGDIPLSVQVKLLRVLQEKEVMPIGGTSIIPIDVRVIAATNQNLSNLVEEGKFRMDLYYRLNVLRLYLPPLKARKEDIENIIKNLLLELGFEHKKIASDLMNTLVNYTWKGNVRELRNCIEYMAYMGGDVLSREDLPEDMKSLESETNLNRVHLFNTKDWFPTLLPKDSELAACILEILKNTHAGRRKVYQLIHSKGLEISEHEVRKIMDFLHEQEIIFYGKGRRGGELTDKGKKMTAEMLL